MKLTNFLFATRRLALVLALPCSCGLAVGAAAPAPAASAAPAAKADLAEIPKSVFVVPTNPKEGRNPFFPYAPQPTVVPKSGGGIFPTDGFLLNGITSPPKRTAMINGRTFEAGETGEVKVNGLKVLIKCEEIRDDSAIINIDGQRRELRLRSGAY